jgi:hypothetical protein
MRVRILGNVFGASAVAIERLQEAQGKGDIAVQSSRPEKPPAAMRRRNKAKPKETPTSRAPKEPKPMVELRGVTEKPVVCGHEVERLNEARYAVVEVLLASGRDGMKKRELEEKSKRSDAVKYLRELRDSSALWKRAIRMAGKAWQRYAIVWD